MPLGLGLLVAGLLAGTTLAQTPPERSGTERPDGSAITDSRLRPSAPGDLPTDIRRDPFSLDSFPTDDPDIPYVPFSRGSEDAADREDELGVPTPEEEIEPETDLAPDFDLFEGPAGRPATPANLAAPPALPGGAENLSATTTSREAAGQNSNLREGPQRGRDGRPLDPLLAARNGGLPVRDLEISTIAARTASIDTITGRQNLPTTALRGAIPIAEDDPFAPVGIRVGTYVLYSTLEQNVGVSSNLSNSVDGESGVFSETILSERLLSDWSRHQFELNGLASYRRNFAGELESEPRLSLDGRFRLDIDRLTTATLRGAVEYRQEDPIDLDATDSLSDRPEILTYSGSADIERQFGRFTATLGTAVLREDRSEPEVADTISLIDESYATYTTSLRTGYEISPALSPFVEGSVGFRRFDEETDVAGIERNSLIQSLRTGVEFDLGEKFLGEIAAGYAVNLPDADSIDTTSSPTLDARIAWSPQRGTDVVFTAGTTFDPDTDGSGTSTLYEGAVALRHRLTHRTDLNGTISLAYRDSEVESEIETSYSAEAGVTYWINRSLAFTGLLRHEALSPKIGEGEYTAETAKIGLRLQR